MTRSSPSTIFHHVDRWSPTGGPAATQMCSMPRTRGSSHVAKCADTTVQPSAQLGVEASQSTLPPVTSVVPPLVSTTVVPVDDSAAAVVDVVDAVEVLAVESAASSAGTRGPQA